MTELVRPVTFRERAGGVLLITAPVLFLACLILVEARWSVPGGYSWLRNNVSDLGNVACGSWDGRPVCSPAHQLMNVGFAANGGVSTLGLLFLFRWWQSRPAVALLALGSLGWVLAGLFPADQALGLHLVGALLILVVGPLGALSSRRLPAPMGALGVASGALAIVGVVGFFSGVVPIEWRGGVERVAAYSVELWLACLGVAVLRQARSHSLTTRAGSQL